MKPFDITSILEQKINDVSILDVIDELQAKELQLLKQQMKEDRKSGKLNVMSTIRSQRKL
jgi:hypothetical protein